MEYDPKIHHRRSIRLQSYNYSWPGAYFVTICASKKGCNFGEIIESKMHENDCGCVVRQQWLESAKIRKELDLDAFIVMPNHVHGILWILGPKGEHVLTNSGVGPSGGRPGPNAIRPYKWEIRSTGRTPFGPTNPIPPMRSRSLASWAAGFKSAVTSRVRKIWDKPRAEVWQEDYFERIIRDEVELNRIREYIQTNPLRWGWDRYNPTRPPDQEDDPEFDS